MRAGAPHMARTLGRLTARKVQNVKEGIEAGRPQTPGMHCDGGGLYLQVTERGALWIYKFALDGRVREMGLGPLVIYGLSSAGGGGVEARPLWAAGVSHLHD